MKQSQLIIAFAILIVMIFGITFAMNYLGSSPTSRTVDPIASAAPREITFSTTVFPPDNAPPLIREERTTGFQDYWFHNANDVAVEFGLVDPSCRCTGVEAFLLPGERRPLLLHDAASLWAVVNSSPVLALALHQKALAQAENGVSGQELLRGQGSVQAPPGGLGWVRVRYKGERQGAQVLAPVLWMNTREGGNRAVLRLRVHFFEALRAKDELRFGTFREEELDRTISRHLLCWSPTRDHLPLEAKLVYSAGPSSEPIELGSPQPLSLAERQALEKEVNEPIASAYRIAVTLLPVSRDGKRPFDLGPFRRWIALSSPETSGEPRTVSVTGLLRGLVDLGGEDEATVVNFRIFKQSRGKSEKLFLQSNESGVKLEFDRQRTPAFLSATLMETKGSDNRQSWEVKVEVLPGKASGPFPRKEDPDYQDSALYFKVSVGGKPGRAIRVAVMGTAIAG